MQSWAWVMAAALAAAGCDSNGAKAGADAGAAAAPSATVSARPAPTAPAPPAAPHPPVITLDERTCTIDGTAFTGVPPEWRPGVAALQHDRPLVAGEAIGVDVMRNVKTPQVAALVAALTEAKARSVVVHTPMRDQSMGELELSVQHAAAADCSAVAMIEHDGAVALWSKGGGVAQKFTHGMAGPDLTSSTEALRKRAAACDSPVWFVSTAETVQWGLAFDLAMRARSAEGGTLRPRQTALLTRTPVAGRRVKED